MSPSQQGHLPIVFNPGRKLFQALQSAVTTGVALHQVSLRKQTCYGDLGSITFQERVCPTFAMYNFDFAQGHFPHESRKTE